MTICPKKTVIFIELLKFLTIKTFDLKKLFYYFLRIIFMDIFSGGLQIAMQKIAKFISKKTTNNYYLEIKK